MLTWPAAAPRRGSAVLLHGVMALAATWWHVGPRLAALGFDASALDLPGHGRAPRLTPDPDRSPAAAQPDRSPAAGLDALVSGVAERLPAPADLLVGHSLGAVVALALAGRHPGIARCLVIEDPPGVPGADLAAFADGISADAALVVRDRDALIRRERQANPRWRAEDVEYSVDGIAQADAEAIAAALRTRLRWDLPALLAEVHAPVLVLAAPEERGSALRGDRHAVRDLVGADRFVVLDAGHCLHRDRPDEWLSAVSAFVDDALR